MTTPMPRLRVLAGSIALAAALAGAYAGPGTAPAAADPPNYGTAPVAAPSPSLAWAFIPPAVDTSRRHAQRADGHLLTLCARLRAAVERVRASPAPPPRLGSAVERGRHP
jgi:hypothetical protein